MQQEDRKVLAMAGGEGLAAGRRLPGFPGDPRLAEMRSKQKLEKEKGTGVWGVTSCPGSGPACGAGRKVKATELSTLPRVLPPGPGKACQTCLEAQPCGWP